MAGRISQSGGCLYRDRSSCAISSTARSPISTECPTSRNPDQTIAAGGRLCEELLEPLQATFGRVAIGSAYRAPAVNALGNRMGLSCASNERNYRRHIWDRRDADGCIGAMASVVVPWFADRYAEGADWRAIAWWIHDHLPYSQLQFLGRDPAARPRPEGALAISGRAPAAASQCTPLPVPC
jgi:hypothetical protein